MESWNYLVVDIVLINWIVPISALMYSQIVVYEVGEKTKRDEYIGQEGAAMEFLYNQWRFVMKWVVPPVIILALILQLIGLIF